MSILKDTLASKIPAWRDRQSRLISRHGESTVSGITMAQIHKGLRGVHAIICDTSYVDPEEGLFIRGFPVLELTERSAEEIFFLLCTGEMPDADARQALQEDLEKRAEIPGYVWDMIAQLPTDAHPMTLLSMSMLAMQRESVFARRYEEGMARSEQWEATLEDALNIIARLPVIAAGVYRKRILGLTEIEPQAGLGFSANFAHMLGIEDQRNEFEAFIRRFVVVHSDHEGANASVLTSRVVNSSLSDLYYSISGAMNCLSGPLHGLANQESVKFVMRIRKAFEGVPKSQQLREFVWAHLNSGKVVPGFGHAVLRHVDPRYLALFHFGKRVCPDDEVFRIVEKLGKVVPPILKEHGKAKNPYPNIDGISGALLYHFGIRDLKFYTVMFSTAQILGICAQLIINRALMTPIIRPKSITTRWLQGHVSDPM